MRFVSVTALSHDGLVREHNEDSLVAGPWTLCATTTLTPQTIYLPVSDPVVVAVADGLGGHAAGEVASALAARRLALSASSLTDEDAIRAALQACNEEIYAEARLHPDRRNMGATVAGVVVIESGVTVFNVGDSRVYLVDGSGLTQVSVDDNEPPWPGQRRSSVVTQTLGGGIPDAAVSPHLDTRPYDASVRYLVCSDGLTDAVDDAAIADVLAGAEGGRAVFDLWRATIEAGAPDNVTIALVEFVEQ